MKIVILYLIFFVGMVAGAMMMGFGNHYGEYITLGSVFLGFYLQFKEDDRWDNKDHL